MNVQTIKIANKVKQVCEEYTKKEIGLLVLQNTLEAICTNFEGDVSVEFQEMVCKFVEDIEYVRFMYQETEHFETVSAMIKKISKQLSRYVE